jgi:hypothetical protein
MRRSIAVAALVVAVLVPLVVAAQGGFGRRGRGPSGFQNPDYDSRFVFSRIRYGGGGFFGGDSWAHDYPQADQHLPRLLEDITALDPQLDVSNVFVLDDPEVFNNPIIYVSEPGFWRIRDSEAVNLRQYLLKGGFIIFDDFEGPQHWNNMAAQMARAVPELRWVEIDVSHPIFHSFFELQSIDAPHPSVRVTPAYYAMYLDNDPNKRMVALANHNSDLAEYWEWSATGMFPVDFTSEAYKLGINYIIYAMTH